MSGVSSFVCVGERVLNAITTHILSVLLWGDLTATSVLWRIFTIFRTHSIVLVDKQGQGQFIEKTMEEPIKNGENWRETCIPFIMQTNMKQ